MSALPQTLPSKRQSENPQPGRGFFPTSHDWPDIIPRITSSATEVHIIWKTASLANRASLDGRCDGWTGPLTSAYLAKITRTTDTGRMVNMALTTLVRRGVLEKKNIKEAIEAGLLKPKDAPVNRIGFILRCRVENWPKCPDAPPPGGEPQKPDTSDEDETPRLPSKVLRLHSEPLVLMPGDKARPIPLSMAVRRRFAAATTIEAAFTASVPLLLDLQMVGDVLRCRVADAPAVQSKGVKKAKPQDVILPSSGNKGVTEHLNSGDPPRETKENTAPLPQKRILELQTLLNPTYLDQFGKTLSSPEAQKIGAALGNCPVDAVEGYSFAHFLRKRLGQKGVITPAHFVLFAQDAARTYQVAPSLPPVVKSEEPYFQRRAREIVEERRKTQWLSYRLRSQ